MANVTRWVGIVLVAVGSIGYVSSGAASVTALIPAFFGLILAVLGAAGQREDRRALTMHLAALLALIGLAGSLMGLVSLPALLTGGDVERPLAVAVQSIMAIVLAVYLVLSVRSFIAASKARKERNAPGAA